MMKDGPNGADRGFRYLACGRRRVERNGQSRRGFLITETEHENYVLKLKWRYPKDLKAGNSGVLVHCQKENKVWPVCVESAVAERPGRPTCGLQTAAEGEVDGRLPPAATSDDKTMRHILAQPQGRGH